MSWFEKVKNVVKTVAENAGEIVVNSVGPSNLGVASAIPTNNNGFWSVLSRPSTSGNGPSESSESESDSERHDVASGSTAEASQVTTRARYTYELDSVSKSMSLSDLTSEPSADKSCTLPYCKLKVTPNAGTWKEESETVTCGDVHRITTRARLTYELDRFQKNALLMFVQMKSEPPPSSRTEENKTQDINVLMDTLSGFRFEVDTHIDLTCNEINNKCQEFFQQDFTQYGAVIVAVLTFDGTTGQLSALDGRFSESIILRHLTYDLNPTLQAKPKIYITEANRISSESGARLSIPLEGHQDVLGLHIPTVEYQSMIRRPLMLICDNIKNMADTHDFATILKRSLEDIETEAHSLFVDKPIEFNNKLTKEIMLARTS